MNTTEQLSILVIEDNPSDSFLIKEMLSSSGLAIRNIYVADRLSDGISILHEHNIHLVLLDLSLPDSFGMNSLASTKELFSHVPVIILTGLADSEMALNALKEGAQDYLVKGEFNSAFLVKSIQYSIGRKRAEEQLLISEKKYRQIFYRNPFPMWISDEQTGQILEANEAALKKYGYTKNEFLQLTLKDIQQSYKDYSLMLPGNPSRDLWRHFKKNGEEMIVEFTTYPIDYFGRIALQVQVNDVTEEIRLEKELEYKNQQMIEAVLNAQEHERKIMGEELHDNINQILTAIKINLGFILNSEEERKDLVEKCMNNTGLAIEEVRKLSRSLIVPSNLRELGLLPSLQIMISDIRTVTPFNIDLLADDFNESLLKEEQKTTLYRIVQEQMNNILKYSEARNVEIKLTGNGGRSDLYISDDGKGFDPTARRKGIGFYNMTNRAKLFGGYVKIDSSPGNGCRVSVRIHSKLPTQNVA